MPEELSVRERGKQDRRNRIIEAARDIIATEGLERLSTRKIAEAAGLSVHTLYSLVGNKQEIMTAVMRTNHNVIGENLQTFGKTDPLAELFYTIDSTCELLQSDARQKPMMLAFGSMQQKGEASAEMDAIMRDGIARLVRPLRRAQEQGILRDDMSVEALGTSLNGVFNFLLRGYLIDKVTMDRFIILCRYSFWLQLSAAATDDHREEFLANAQEQSDKAGF